MKSIDGLGFMVLQVVLMTNDVNWQHGKDYYDFYLRCFDAWV